MEHTEAKWKERVVLLQEFLKLTKKISDLLVSLSATERVEEIAALIDERSKIIKMVTQLNDQSSSIEIKLPEEEEKHKWLCKELLLQIQEIETENIDTITMLMNGVSERMRTNKQSRDTIGAYSKQMHDSAQEGTMINRTK